jgi:hypothetical protein
VRYLSGGAGVLETNVNGNYLNSGNTTILLKLTLRGGFIYNELDNGTTNTYMNGRWAR